MYHEDDIKYEGQHFTVIYNRALSRYEVLKANSTHGVVVGHGPDVEACIRTAKIFWITLR